eukprot:5605427-Pyramimonas_sp.AAC.1
MLRETQRVELSTTLTTFETFTPETQKKLVDPVRTQHMNNVAGSDRRGAMRDERPNAPEHLGNSHRSDLFNHAHGALR